MRLNCRFLLPSARRARYSRFLAFQRKKTWEHIITFEPELLRAQKLLFLPNCGLQHCMTCVRDRLEEERGSIESSVVRTHVVESPNLADLNGVIDGGAPPVCHAGPGLQFIHFADITAQNPRRAWTWMEHPIDNVSRDCGVPDGISDPARSSW